MLKLNNMQNNHQITFLGLMCLKIQERFGHLGKFPEGLYKCQHWGVNYMLAAEAISFMEYGVLKEDTLHWPRLWLILTTA